MAKYEVNPHNFEQDFGPALDEAMDLADKDYVVSVEVKRKNNGTWPMLKLWRAWMSQVCDYMNVNGNTMPLYFTKDGQPVGKRAMTPDDCHEAFTHLMLGCDDNGVRLSWALSEAGADGKQIADTGQRLRAMDKMWMLGVEKGIPLINPQDSEYNKLKGEE